MNHGLSVRNAVLVTRMLSFLAVLLLLVTGCTRTVETGDPQELIHEAWGNYRLGEFKSAADKFSRVVETVPESDPVHLMALYGLATTWNLRRPKHNPALAVEYYHRLLELDPEGDLAPWCDLALARMKHIVPVGQEPDYDDVRSAYLAIMDKRSGHIAAQEAVVYYYSTYVATLAKEDARKALEGIERFIVENPESGFLSAAYSLAAFCCETLGDQEKRTRMEVKSFETMEVDPFNPFSDNAWRYWRIAALAEFEAGDFDLARKFYRMLIEEYPQDIRKYASRQALRRMDKIESGIRAELQAEGS
ncbi:MAG: tetratricopeptide repeat protein [Lentisphaerae bacterium]|nr:tetratricopeptide repeat protein [Lentisphaerota bacterium]